MMSVMSVRLEPSLIQIEDVSLLTRHAKLMIKMMVHALLAMLASNNSMENVSKARILKEIPIAKCSKMEFVRNVPKDQFLIKTSYV